MNKAILIGYICTDIELRHTQNDIPVATFTLAVNRNSEESDFIPIVVWRKQAENCSKYISKGSKVAIEGTIQTRSYEKDGQKRYITEVVAQSVQFLDNVPVKKENPYQEFANEIKQESLPF